MTLYRSLDQDSPFHKTTTPCLRKEIFFFVSKLSTEKILNILLDVNVEKYLPTLKRLTLLNLMTDLSIEPMASQIIEEFRHENKDFHY